MISKFFTDAATSWPSDRAIPMYWMNRLVRFKLILLGSQVRKAQVKEQVEKQDMSGLRE